VGQTVTFTVGAADSDGDALTFSWNYGDGTTNSNASHAYAAAGTYTATVTVSDGHSNTVSSSVNVTVNSLSGSGPVVTTPLQAWPSNPALGQKVLFTISVSDTNGYSIAYNYGDGATGAVENHIYTTNGAYTVTTTITDSHGGTATSSTTVTAGTGGSGGGSGSNPVITTPLHAWPSNPTLGQKVLFTISVSDSYSYSIAYNYGDGTNGVVEDHVYNTNGTYTVTTTVTDNHGGTATSSTTVVAGTGGSGGGGGGNQAPVFTAPVQAWPGTASVGQQVLFTLSASDPDGDPVSVVYNYGDGSAAGYTEHHTYTSAGSYTVVVTASDGKGVSVTSQTTVTVK
jgi:PKD repeat protein